MRRLSTAGVLACLALAGCGGGDDGGSGGGPASTIPAGGATASGNVVTVSMRNIKFVPHDVTAKAGQTIRWTNDDAVAHTVTARSGASFDSGTVSPGKTFTTKVVKTGKIAYVCQIHPGQTGTITVR
jgi:plastocyanin